jgi:hypothetical protein
MITINQVREDLKEIRYYYSMQKLFDSAANTVKPVAILNKVDRYNAVMKLAPAKLYIIYMSLYVQNNTQAALAEEWGYTREYVKEINQKLVEYLHKALA